MDITSVILKIIAVFIITYSLTSVVLVFLQDNVTNKDLASSILFSLIAILIAFPVYHKLF